MAEYRTAAEEGSEVAAWKGEGDEHWQVAGPRGGSVDGRPAKVSRSYGRSCWPCDLHGNLLGKLAVICMAAPIDVCREVVLRCIVCVTAARLTPPGRRSRGTHRSVSQSFVWQRPLVCVVVLLVARCMRETVAICVAAFSRFACGSERRRRPRHSVISSRRTCGCSRSVMSI